MFSFSGKQLFLIAFKETHQVQVFECHNGHYSHEFTFYDDVVEQVRHNNHDNHKHNDKGERNAQDKEDYDLEWK